MISVLVASYGDPDRWTPLARRAVASTDGQGFGEVIAYHRDDGTLAQVRNEAAMMARCRWLLFLDADDELDPGFCAAMEHAIRVWNAGPLTLLTPAVSYSRGRPRQRPKIWPRVDIRDGNWMVIGTLINRATFEHVGGFHEWPMYEDWCLWQRVLKLSGDWPGETVVEVPDAIYLAQAVPGSRNRGPNSQQRQAAHAMIRRANFPDLYDAA